METTLVEEAPEIDASLAEGSAFKTLLAEKLRTVAIGRTIIPAKEVQDMLLDLWNAVTSDN